jgi:hypothetical protein
MAPVVDKSTLNRLELSTPASSSTRAANSFMPLRKSTGCIAINTRLGPGEIIRLLMRWTAKNARKTASTSGSMVAERTACAGSLACPESTEITSTNSGCPSPGSAKRPPFRSLDPIPKMLRDVVVVSR